MIWVAGENLAKHKRNEEKNGMLLLHSECTIRNALLHLPTEFV